ncbi:MAG: hypothetical protein JXR83_09830 [Deltaproteobacteria bacterium]|nr:hypothetical protein [Deltaproteobacteria bacterium]
MWFLAAIAICALAGCADCGAGPAQDGGGDGGAADSGGGDAAGDAARDAATADGRTDAGGADRGSDAGGRDAVRLDRGSVEREPELDPAPGHQQPGEYTDGTGNCPDTEPATTTIQAGEVTSYTFSGVVDNAVGNGTFYVRGRNQEEISGEIPTAGDGSYSVTVPLFCGDSLVKRIWSNATCSYVLVTRVSTSSCVDADMRITLVWDAIGVDWELHLIRPGGQINDDASDCTWTSCVHASPDWGVVGDSADDPHKDVDWLYSYGPENIWLDRPQDGIYTVLVEHWNSSGSTDSDGRVIINLWGKLVVVDIQDLAPWHVWTAASISWPDGLVATSQSIYDCSGNWSGGCRATLP